MKRLLACCVVTLIAAFLLVSDSHSAEKKSSSRSTSTAIAQTATPIDAIQSLPGFKVERLYSVPADKQGSWVALTVDDQGRLIASDQYGSLFRITPPAIGVRSEPRVEKLAANIGSAQGLLYAFKSLYVVVNEGRETAERPSGLYRLRDTKGTDQFDEIKLLRRFEGSGEHGPHAVIQSPDRKSLYVVAGNFTKIPNPDVYRAPKVWAEDQLLPRMPDGNGFAANIFAPAGWV
jgi:hypothetical protein